MIYTEWDYCQDNNLSRNLRPMTCLSICDLSMVFFCLCYYNYKKDGKVILPQTKQFCQQNIQK